MAKRPEDPHGEHGPEHECDECDGNAAHGLNTEQEMDDADDE